MRGKLLTDRTVKSAKPGARRREIPDGGTGLYLIVHPSGVKAWAVRYRFRGRPRKLTLGKYPVLRLAKAREAAGEALQKIEQGVDPADEKAEVKRREPDLVRNVGAAFIERYCKPRLRTWKKIERALERHVYPSIGDRDIKDVTRRDILDLLDAAAERPPFSIFSQPWMGAPLVEGAALETDISPRLLVSAGPQRWQGIWKPERPSASAQLASGGVTFDAIGLQAGPPSRPGGSLGQPMHDRCPPEFHAHGRPVGPVS